MTKDGASCGHTLCLLSNHQLNATRKNALANLGSSSVTKDIKRWTPGQRRRRSLNRRHFPGGAHPHDGLQVLLKVGKGVPEVDKQKIRYNLPGLGFVLNGATTIRITVKKSAICIAQTLCRVLQFSIMLSVVKLSVVMLRTVLLNAVQGILTEGESSVQLTSSLRQLVL